MRELSNILTKLTCTVTGTSKQILCLEGLGPNQEKSGHLEVIHLPSSTKLSLTKSLGKFLDIR